MDLPLAEEIRAARRLAEEGADALNHVLRIDDLYINLDGVDNAASLGVTEMVVPGDDFVDLLAERWPLLADLASAGPRPTQTLSERSRLRRQQLEGARQILLPMSSEAHARVDRLHDLQHEQRHMLDDPRYADDVAELVEIGNERHEVGTTLHPLAVLVSSVKGTLGVVTTLRDTLAQITADPLPRPGAREWRAALVARNYAATATKVTEHLVGLDLPRPIVRDIGDAADPDPEVAAALLAYAEGVIADMTAIMEKLGAAYEQRAGTVADLQTRFDELTRQITDRMG